MLETEVYPVVNFFEMNDVRKDMTNTFQVHVLFDILNNSDWIP